MSMSFTLYIKFTLCIYLSTTRLDRWNWFIFWCCFETQRSRPDCWEHIYKWLSCWGQFNSNWADWHCEPGCSGSKCGSHWCLPSHWGSMAIPKQHPCLWWENISNFERSNQIYLLVCLNQEWVHRHSCCTKPIWIYSAHNKEFISKNAERRKY